MGFEEPVETTFREAKCTEEKEVDISRHLGLGFVGDLGLAFAGHFAFRNFFYFLSC